MNEVLGWDDAGPFLVGSRDSATGEVYFPARAFSTDGSLRPCAELKLSRTGVLATWTTFAGHAFGQVDLADRVRVQTELAGLEHEIGAVYALRAQREADTATWSFHRV